MVCLAQNPSGQMKQKSDARCYNLPMEFKCRWKSHCFIPFPVYCHLLHWKSTCHLFFSPSFKKLSNKREQKLFYVCENIFIERQWKCSTGRLWGEEQKTDNFNSVLSGSTIALVVMRWWLHTQKWIIFAQSFKII